MIRPANLTDAEDQPFILSGWSSSYRMSRDATTPMPLYAAHKHEEIRWYLSKPRVETLIHGAVVRHGFICFEHSAIGNPPLVHYIYVAQPYRRRGIARALFDAARIDPGSRFEYAARTRASWELRSKAPFARHNSLRARSTEERTSTP